MAFIMAKPYGTHIFSSSPASGPLGARCAFESAHAGNPATDPSKQGVTLGATDFQTEVNPVYACAAGDVAGFVALPVARHEGNVGKSMQGFDVFGLVAINKRDADTLRRAGLHIHDTMQAARCEAASLNRQSEDLARGVEAPSWKRISLSDPLDTALASIPTRQHHTIPPGRYSVA